MDFSGDLTVDGSNDPHARHKMPSMKVKHINKKGGQTELTNLEDVATALFREPKDIFRYLQVKLNTSGTAKRQLLNGTWTQEVLQKYLSQFVQEQVICTKCKQPDTRIDDNKIHCQGCGHDTKLL